MVEIVSQAGSAVAAGTVDMKPGYPIEGILIAQLVDIIEAARGDVSARLGLSIGLRASAHEIANNLAHCSHVDRAAR